MRALTPSDPQRSKGSTKVEGRPVRQGPEPQRKVLIPVDPIGCEADVTIEGKTRQEALVVANRILWRSDIKPKEVAEIVSAVNACEPAALSGAESLDWAQSLFFCERCLERMVPGGIRKPSVAKVLSARSVSASAAF